MRLDIHNIDRVEASIFQERFGGEYDEMDVYHVEIDNQQTVNLIVEMTTGRVFVDGKLVN